MWRAKLSLCGHAIPMPSRTLCTAGPYPAEDAGLLEEYAMKYPSGTDELLRF